MIFEYEGRKVFDGKVVEGFFHYIDGTPFITPYGTAVAKEVEPQSVRMWIGQMDKNKRKIHEYDVVRFQIEDLDEELCECDYLVLWDKTRCGFYAMWVENVEERDCIDPYFCENCVVIGNALDDPTLAGVHQAKVEAAKSQTLANLIEDVTGGPREEGDADGGLLV